MAKRSITDARTGKTITGEAIKIKEIKDPPIEMTLEDGSVLRLRMDIYEAVRIPGQYDPEGYPAYHVRHSGMLSVISAPPELCNRQ